MLILYQILIISLNMAFSDSIVDVTLALNSQKKKERLNAFENLTSLLNQERVVVHLCKSTKTKSNFINWDIVFIRVHNAALTLVDDNNSKKGQIVDKHLQIMQNAISQVVQQSFYQKVLLINSSLIVSSTLAIFESELRIKALGAIYLNILNKYVLAQGKKWYDVKEENWIGIKNLCKKQFFSPPQGIHSALFLEILSDVVRYSSKVCQISSQLLDLFDFVKNIFSCHKFGSNFESVLLRLTNTLCLQLAIEFRFKVCEFMENIFDFVMSIYEKKKPKKNTLIYDFLLTMVNVHNPSGLWEDKSSYAFDSSKWKKQIREIMFLCQEEVKYVLKHPNDYEDTGFLDLFVYVSHLMVPGDFESFPESEEIEISFDEPGPSNKRKSSFEASNLSSIKSSFDRSKRIKLEIGFKNLQKDLKTSDAWFWLKFLELLLHNYPTDLKSDYCQYAEILYQLMCDKREIENSKLAIRCLCGFLKLESSVELQLTSPQTRFLTELWNKISSELVRLLKTENYSETHLLIRSLISASKFSESESFIKLYCDNQLNPGLENFETLCFFCQNCVLVENIFGEEKYNVRERLLLWLLNENEKYPCKDLAKLLICLILKRFEEEIESLVENENILISRNNINDFCKLITSNYMTVSFRNITFVESSKVVENNFEIRIDKNIIKKLLKILIKYCDVVQNAVETDSCSRTEKLKNIHSCVWLCELLCHLISHIENMNKLFDEKSLLYENLQKLLSICTVKCQELLEDQFFDLSLFNKLYSTHFHKNVMSAIRHSNFISLKFLQVVFEKFKNYELENKGTTIHDENDVNSYSKFSQLINNPRSVLHFQSLTKREQIIVNCVEFICQYVSVPEMVESNTYQNILARKTLDNLLENSLDLNSNFQLQLVLRVVYSFTKHKNISTSVLNSSLDLLEMILNAKISDPEVFIIVLQILKDLVYLVQTFGDDNSRLLYIKILDEVSSIILIKKNCGSKGLCMYIECLCEISKMDLEGRWTKMERKGATIKIFENIVYLIMHSLHEVRLKAAQNVGLLFVFDKNTKNSILEWQSLMLESLIKILSDAENVRPKDGGPVTEYFDTTFCSTSLLSLANIICHSSYWRKKCLFYLLYLANIKKFEKGKVKDILSFICREMKISSYVQYISSNLIYIILEWTEKSLNIQDFPYYLLEYKTFEDFFQENLSIIVISYLLHDKIDVLNLASAKLNKPIHIIIKECHCIFMSFILPGLNENVDGVISKKAQKLKRFVEEKVPHKESIRLLTTHIDEVLYYLFRNIHDSSYLNKICKFIGNIKDDRSFLSFNGGQVIETLENLSNNEDKPLLAKLAIDCPSAIEKILLKLQGDIEHAVVNEDKVFAFYKYIFFVESLSQKINNKPEFRNINVFVIRDVVHAVASIVRKNKNEILQDMACECLLKLSQAYLKKFSKVLGEFLPAIVTILIPLVKQSNSKARFLLNFLICENYSKLESHILLLDSFPADEIFSSFNQQMAKNKNKVTSLESVIKHFVESERSKNSTCRIEGLKNLRLMLSERKTELKRMYDDLKKLRGFSEDCKKSLLHQLICLLVELTAKKNVVVKTEAANCLGELGPADLTTLALRPENDFAAFQEPGNAINRLIISSITILSNLIINENYEVKKACSNVLHSLLSTQQGKEVINSKAENLNSAYLTPFASFSKGFLKFSIVKEFFIQKLSDPKLWMPVCHEKWIVALLDVLLQSLKSNIDVINPIRELANVHWEFAENIFPSVLDLILSLNEKNFNETIFKNINDFFMTNFNYKTKDTKSLNKASVQCMVNVVDYIRIQRNLEGVYEGFVSNINYLHMAKAALYCSAFFTSIFYAELWFEEKRKKEDVYMDINMICEYFPEEGFALTEILRECYSKIGNSDGIHGCGYMHILNSSSEIQHYEQLRNWNLSMLHHDIQLSQGTAASDFGLLNSFENSEMYYTLNNLIKNHNSVETSKIQFKCAARLQDWSQIDSTNQSKNQYITDCFDRSFYFSLKAFHDEDDATFQKEVQKARKSILNELTLCSLESCKNLYLPLSELQKLKELEEFATVVRKLNKDHVQSLFGKWNEQDTIKCGEFKLVEDILSNRTILIKDILKKTEDPELKITLELMLCEIYHKIIKLARKEKRYETAIRNLSYICNIKSVSPDIDGKMKLEKSRILWEKGDKEIGKFLLSHFLKQNELKGELKAKSLRIYGDWMAQTKLENSKEIIENYYIKSISQFGNCVKRINSFESLAKFADANYEQLNEYLSSPLFEIKQSLINTQQDLASELRQELGWNQNKEKRMAYQIATKQSVIDENEIKNSKAERDSYLNLALKYYLLSLKEGEKSNLCVFRVISLWLSNSSNQEVIQQLQKSLHLIPTYKFLCLLPQLVPRMPDVCLISNLIEKILLDHPHHTLPLILALRNSYEDLKFNGVKSTPTTPRVLAAKSMLEKFENHSKLKKLISEMRDFFHGLIELANYNPSEKGRQGSINFPDTLKIKHLIDLTTVSVPSLDIPYNKNCIYDNIIGVHKFEKSYYLVGGVNLPKRVTCIGTDGIGRTLLVKGKDDLRQDAVMQQVFTIMNSLLCENSETNKRKLIIRTYKVVPLSQRSGVIEWCENTQPLSLYLVGPDGKSGAHQKFYPKDTPALDCRIMIKKIFSQPQVRNEDKLKIFLEICKQIHPVFHYFFIEKFPAAGVWFERRLAYTHSVATSSMIGYILGIGDRHVHNILIDNSTAEVIHIDLGIAFEQGKTLPTPETIPFRLTRDIVDGMGLSGVEGDFRISSVKTMEVLRQNQDTILTLLQVLLYDPLYTWTITPEKAYSMQNHTETSSSVTEKSSPDLEINKMAERALIRLKQKLQGTEAGCIGTNIEGQVSYLIQQARDPNNLCRLFHGWQAYL